MATRKELQIWKQLKMNMPAKILIIPLFAIYFLLFTITSVFAQEAPPDPGNSPVLKAKNGAAFSEGWNYFTLGFNECSAKNVLDELQADGGSALTVGTLYTKELFGWNSYSFLDSNSANKKINENQQLAFNSNQKFFLEMTQDTCLFPNSQRQAQIDEIKEGSVKKTFAERVAELPADLWGKLMTLLNNDAPPPPEVPSVEKASFENLTIGGKTTVNDLGVTGVITSGLLSVDGLNATINSLSDIKFKLPGGQVDIDKNGNLKIQKLLINEVDNASKSVGSAAITTGSTSIDVQTSSVTSNSKVFVTATSETGGQALIVKSKTAGKEFRVIIEKAHTSNITFDWFIIN